MMGTQTANPEFTRSGALTSVRWSTVSVFAQQAGRVVVSLALARLLGPKDYGVIAQAGIYLALMAVLLDQGLGSALIQRPELEAGAAGSVLWANMIAGSI